MSKKRETKVASDGGPEEDVRRVDESLTIEDREQLERFRLHQARFGERRMWAGYCRWMAQRFGAPATAQRETGMGAVAGLDTYRAKTEAKSPQEEKENDDGI